MQTIWHDENGRVKAVYDGDTTSTAWADRGYTKASVPDDFAPVTTDHTVSVSDGVVTGKTYDPPPRTEADWLRDIAATRYEHEVSGTTFTHSDGSTYGVGTDRQSQALVTGAAVQAQRNGISKQWKTSEGFVTLTADDILAMGDAVDDHVQKAFDREAELVAKVSDGSITEDDLEKGWP